MNILPHQIRICEYLSTRKPLLNWKNIAPCPTLHLFFPKKKREEVTKPCFVYNILWEKVFKAGPGGGGAETEIPSVFLGTLNRSIGQLSPS